MNKAFEPIDFSGSNTITDESIRNHFKREMEPWQPIAELIWNGFDAGAKEIYVTIRENTADGTESVTILDDGKGIDFAKPLDNFRRFNDSLKKKSHAMHGSKGRGRLAFHKICNSATWFTKFDGVNAKISIDSSSLRDISGITIPLEEQNALLHEKESGTCVELINFLKNLPPIETLAHQLSLEFGWHLAFSTDKLIRINEILIAPPKHSKAKNIFTIDGATFEVDLIQWSEKLNSEKSYTYLIDSTGTVIHHIPSSLNYKPGYYTSLYVTSDWFDAYSSEQSLSVDIAGLTASKTWRLLTKHINNFTQDHYREFLITLADEQIEEFIKEGDFPDYSGFDPSYSTWRFNHTKNIVRTIILSDPKLLQKSNKRQRKIIIRLLDKISVSSENCALLDVLESVLDLDSATMTKFATQIKKSRLNNIIQTIETLQKRELAVTRITEIMRNHYKETLETPDLQGVIEANTWLFGSQYETIGAEEDTFTNIAKKLRESINGINEINEEDLEDEATVDGANRQVDLFLVRRTKQFNSLNQPYFRCVIIEIKRPSIALNKHHLRQVDDYAAILSRHHDFNGINTKYEIILVGRKISSNDYDINSRLSDLADKNEPGLIGSGPIKRYVKTWTTIIEEFRISNDYLLGVLQTQRDNLENETKDELLTALHKQTA